MIAVIGLIIGIVLGVLLDPTVPAWLAPFLPVAVVAGLDALFGAGRASLRRPSIRHILFLECCRGLPPCVSGDAARCWLGNDDGSCCRPWHSYFL